MTEQLTFKNVTESGGPRTVTLDLSLEISIREVKKQLQESFASRPVPSSQRIICNGQVLTDDTVVREVLSGLSKPYTLYLVEAKDRYVGGSQSVPAPRPSNGETSVGTQQPVPRQVQGAEAPPVQQRAPQNVVDPAPARPDGDPAPAAPLGMRLGGFQVQWSLLFKLMFVVFLLSQNGSPRNFYVLGTIALLIYFWQTGRFEVLAARVAEVFPALRQRRRFEENAPPVATSTASVVPRRSRSWLVYFATFVASFVLSFFCSLFPSWKAQQMIPAPPSARDAPEARPHQD